MNVEFVAGMTRSDASNDAAPESDALDLRLLALLAGTVAVAALLFYFRGNEILLYGDAVAHINIARRVFDSRTPGLGQLGTVWLPLPHILNIPFVINDHLWQTGLGGAVPSMVAYVFGVLGIFRLVRGMASRVTAWVAAAIFGLNPNLLYLQATAMTESLYIALFIWSVVYFSEFVQPAENDDRNGRRSLEKCGLLVSAAMLVRYDGWFLAALIAIAALIVCWRMRAPGSRLRRALVNYALLVGATGALWLAYNYARYGNPLEFANGPYSAHAIQERSRTPTWRSYPGENSPRTAALYFLKASRINLGYGNTEYLLFTLAFVGLLCVCCFARQYLPWALLWSPVVFYTASIAWGSVPVYLPQWWPFTYYNVRYGLQMLPAVAVFSALLVEFATRLFPKRRIGAAAIVLMITALSYTTVWHRTPIVLREARVNGTTRMIFEQQLALALSRLPKNATLMMDCSSYSGAIQDAGIPFRRVLRESNPPYWDAALREPAQSADYVIAIDHDVIAAAVKLFPGNLKAVATVGTPDTRHATIYRSVRE